MDANGKELSTILKALNEHGKGMTIMDISKAVGLNRHSVAKYLEVLVASGQVDRRSFGPSKIFSVSQRIPVSAMLSFSSDLIITMDKDLHVRYVNDKFLEFMGLERDMIFRKSIQVFSRYLQTEPPLLPYIQAALEGQESSIDLFNKGVTKNYHFLMKALPTVFEDGERGVTLIMSDISARVEAEAALRQERGELEMRVRERTAELEAEIAKRTRYEHALKSSEEKYRNLVETINDVAWEIDAEGRFTYISPKIRDMIGYEPSDFLGKTIVSFLAPSHAKEITGSLGEFFGHPEPYSLQETHVLHKDGRELVVEANAVALYDENGGFAGFRGVIRDITARNQAEEALRRSEEQYRNLVENVGEWIWENDMEGHFTYSSPKVFDLLGYRPEEIIGLRPHDLMTPENAEKMRETVKLQEGKGEYPSVLEAELIHRDGRPVFLEVSGKPVFDRRGNQTGYRGVSRDVTARKQAEEALRRAEEKLRNTIENVNDIVWEMGPDAKFTYVSPKVKDILGYGPEHYVGHVISDFMPPEDMHIFLPGFGRIFAKPRPYSFEFFRMIHKDGRILSFEVNGSPFYDENGQFAGFQGVTRDVTGRK